MSGGPARRVDRMHPRHMQTEFGEQACDAQIRNDVLMLGRGIHDDAAAALGAVVTAWAKLAWAANRVARAPRLAQTIFVRVMSLEPCGGGETEGFGTVIGLFGQDLAKVKADWPHR